ncbi:hypothetical protein BIW11_04795 [Tropilaelaps mercedesae]|uniref:Uncharacterized protein n=1 Tax=Tropilaelaps mercedesae TaxID=418985 RepID=A0A1V9X239_9ACAR|nr:hypothetical protein BIW11_04795 [Tropilaelaps mercedesae]
MGFRSEATVSDFPRLNRGGRIVSRQDCSGRSISAQHFGAASTQRTASDSLSLSLTIWMDFYLRFVLAFLFADRIRGPLHQTSVRRAQLV